MDLQIIFKITDFQSSFIGRLTKTPGFLSPGDDKCFVTGWGKPLKHDSSLSTLGDGRMTRYMFQQKFW